MSPRPSTPELRCFFDAGSGAVVWPGHGTQELGSPVDLESLPISRALRVSLAWLAQRYDGSVNWAEPNCPWFWREADCAAFNEAAHRAVSRLRAELGPKWTVQDGFEDVHEDPDLDRYLADPANFRP